jgi:hypothetical protein
MADSVAKFEKLSRVVTLLVFGVRNGRRGSRSQERIVILLLA